MAKQKRSGQTWWPMYAVALIMVGLMFLAHRVAPSPGWRHFLEVSVLVAGYSSIWLWLEKHPGVLLDRSQAELPELERPSPLSSHVQVHFYVYSDPAIIYDMPEYPTSRLGSNGHHPARTIHSLPEAVANQFTNN